jgi:HEAT repeat protein
MSEGKRGIAVRRWALVFAGFSAAIAVAAPPVPDPDQKEVVKKLVEALKDPDPDVRQNLGAALAKIGPDAIEPLVEALKGDNPDRRAGAAYTLGLIGPPAKAALPALLEALKDESVEVRRQASYAVARLIPDNRVSKEARDAKDKTAGDKK